MLTAVILLTGCVSGSRKSDPDKTAVPDINETAAPKTTEQPTSLPADRPLIHNEYIISMDVNPLERTVTGIEKVKFINKSGKDLDNICFNLYLNAFSEESPRNPVFPRFESRVYANGKDYGYINILNISFNNEDVTFSLDNTALKIDLDKPLAPNGQAEVTLQFEAKIPKINAPTGANDNAIWFGNFLPTLAVYKDDRFHTTPYYPAGDPAYTEVANYTVSINTPIDYIVAGTGIDSSKEFENKKTTTFTVQLVRDFAFAVSDKYRQMSFSGDSGVEINMFYYSDIKNIQSFLELADKAIDLYSKKIGGYPYKELDIVECALQFPSSKAYPQVIFMDTTYIHDERAFKAIAKDVCHQWFYNIVGNDQINEAWLDEGLASLLQEYLFSDEAVIYGMMMEEHAKLSQLLNTMPNKSLLDDTGVYESWADYYNVQNTRSKLMFYALRLKIGSEKFEQFLKEYYYNYSFKIAHKEDMVSTASAVYGKDLAPFFREWIGNDKMPELPPFTN